MTNYDKNREFTRIPIKIVAEVSFGACTLAGRIRDVSMKGLFLLHNKKMSPGTDCRVVIFLGEGNQQLSIEASGKCVRNDEFGVAIEFVDIGTESYNHLRNLVLYNTEGAQTHQVEEEFKNHLGLKKCE